MCAALSLPGAVNQGAVNTAKITGPFSKGPGRLVITPLLHQAWLSSSTCIHATKPEKSIRTHFPKRIDPEKTHVPVDLDRKDIDGMADTGLAGNRGRINKRTADEDE